MNSMMEGALRLVGILALAILGSSIAIGTALAPFALA
jgi:hypothetical protein